MIIMCVRVAEVFASVPTHVNVTRATSGTSANSERASVEMKLMLTCVMDMALVPTLTIAIALVDGPVYSVNCRCVLA